MPRGNGMGVRLLIAQGTGEVPVPGQHLPACPALVIFVAAQGCRIFMGSPPFMETDKTRGVAFSKPSFLILQACCFQFLSTAGRWRL